MTVQTMDKPGQILIVGAGPTGLAMAVELARRGIQIRILDKVPQRPSQEARAEGIHSKTLEIFERMGVLPDLLVAGTIKHGFSFFANAKHIGRLAMKGLATPFPYLLFLPQSELERLLIEHLARLGVEVERPVEVVHVRQDADIAYATVRYASGEVAEISADYIVAADGGHSTIRKLLKLDFPGRQIEGAYVMDVEMETVMPLLHDEGNVLFGKHSVMVAGRRADGIWRLGLSFPPGDTRLHKDSAPTIEQVQQVLDEDYPYLGARLQKAVWSSAFFISSRLVNQTRTGRIFLTGDAAHINSPAGGQGMNTGVQDAANLAWKLALRLQGYGNDALLESYQAERYPVMKRLIKTTTFASQFLSLAHPVAMWARNGLIGFLTKLPFMQTKLISTYTGFEVHYTNSPIIAPQSPRLLQNKPQPGDISPDAPGLVTAAGTVERWYSLWGTDTRHQLLIFAGKQHDARLSRLADTIAADYGELVRPHLVTLQVDNATANLYDSEGLLHRRYRAENSGLFLLRPDGYIAFRGAISDERDLITYLDKTLSRNVSVPVAV